MRHSEPTIVMNDAFHLLNTYHLMITAFPSVAASNLGRETKQTNTTTWDQIGCQLKRFKNLN